jgi:hypothetical protein
MQLRRRLPTLDRPSWRPDQRVTWQDSEQMESRMFCVFCERRRADFVLRRRGVAPVLGVCSGCRTGLDRLVEQFGPNTHPWVLVPMESHTGEPFASRIEEQQAAAAAAADEIVRHGGKRRS